MKKNLAHRLEIFSTPASVQTSRLTADVPELAVNAGVMKTRFVFCPAALMKLSKARDASSSSSSRKNWPSPPCTRKCNFFRLFVPTFNSSFGYVYRKSPFSLSLFWRTRNQLLILNKRGASVFRNGVTTRMNWSFVKRFFSVICVRKKMEMNTVGAQLMKYTVEPAFPEWQFFESWVETVYFNHLWIKFNAITLLRTVKVRTCWIFNL